MESACLTFFRLSSLPRPCRAPTAATLTRTLCFANSTILTSYCEAYLCSRTRALIRSYTRFSKQSRASVVASAKNVASKEQAEISSPKIETETDTDVPPEYEYIKKKLLGDEPDFFEGPQWNSLGFVVQYLWAFGILLSLVACGVAVRTYNLGASDFRGTEIFKEALETSGELDLEADTEGSADPLALDAPPLSAS